MSSTSARLTRTTTAISMWMISRALCWRCSANRAVGAGDSVTVMTAGIPDECEGEALMGGGSPLGSPFSGPTLGSVGGDPDAWAAFFEWSMDQSWGAEADISGAAQFQMMVNKLDELGLPLSHP